MRRILLVAGWIWALPTSLIGLLFALVTAKPVELLPLNVWRWEARPWLVALMPKGWQAITFGTVLVMKWVDPGAIWIGGISLASIIRHERCHTLQSFFLGILFLPVYGVSCFVAWGEGEDVYRGCWMERQAYRYQDKPDAWG